MMRATTATTDIPSASERRRAVARALGRGPAFLRFAARYAASPEDAEDAYQQAMEIALASAPSVEPRRFDAWLYAVVRNEALATRRRRGREAPQAADDLAAGDRAVAPEARRPDVIAEWRERHGAVKEALSGLSDTQRSCLILRTAGLGHDQIAELTGRPLRQVERAISRGRARVIEWESAIASGAACERLRPAIEHVARGGGRPVDHRRVEGHVRRCVPCREVLAARRRLDPQLAALVPAALIPMSVPQVADVSVVTAYADRLVVGSGARMAQLGQLMVELPAAGVGRLGTKGLALVAAAAAGLPIVTGQLAESPPQPPPIVATPATTPPAAPDTTTGLSSTDSASSAADPVRTVVPAAPVKRPAPRASAPPVPVKDVAPRPKAAPPKAATPAPAPPARVVVRPAPAPVARAAAPRPTTAPRGTAAAEFGP